MIESERNHTYLYERGLFVKENVFDPQRYNHIFHLLTNLDYLEHINTEYESFNHHPRYVTTPDDIRAQVEPILFTNEDIFSHISLFNLSMFSRSFIIKYDISTKNGLEMHYDGHDNQQILSVIFTFRHECIGGSLIYANTNSGDIDTRNNKSKDTTYFYPKDNSVYFFNGSYVCHGSTKVTKGTRYAIVLFYITKQTIIDAVRLWNPKCNYVCERCNACYVSPKGLKRHTKHKH